MLINLPPGTPPEIEAKINASLKEIELVQQREMYEDNLLEFVKGAWSSIDSSEYQDSWVIEAMCDHLECVVSGHIKRLLINVPPRCSKTSIVSIIFPVWVWARSEITYLSGPQVKFLCASFNQGLSLESSTKSRRLMGSPWFQKYWGDKIKFHADQNTKTDYGNTFGGVRKSTSVGSMLLGLGGDILIADDLNKVKNDEVETEDERESVQQFWSEFSSTRLNNPKKSAIIGVQQRLHQSDMSGLILDGEEDFVHLMVPMRYDETRARPTIVLPQYNSEEPWEDPRKYTGEELMWPERFGETEVRSLETKLGPYMCTPKESPILMSDLSMKSICDVVIGDEVVGFSTDTGREEDPDADYLRRKLVRSKVIGKTSLVSSIVKITLDSGRVIRCTPDHKWYVGKSGGRRGYYPDGRPDIRPLYRAATVGRALMRVCPPELPVLSYDDQRKAGWLSGFFDGEGSAGFIQDRPTNRQASQIRFHQGTGRNKILCDILEEYLTYFGFGFRYSDRIRSDKRVNIDDPHMCRVYEVLRPFGALVMIQRFLHIIKPNKWKDRITNAAYGANWISSQEKVVSIDPDGEETVYALETETGNYVVWGIASANSSGRLQQMPTPKGGAIIRSDWWQLWDKHSALKYGLEWGPGRGGKPVYDYPEFELVVGSIDTAYGEKEENDYSAMTVWGIWIDNNKNRRAMLVYAWQKRLPLHGRIISVHPGEAAVQFEERRQSEWGLVELVADTCKRYNVKRLLIEDKSRGRDVAQEINRLYAREQWGTQLVNPVGDKVSRGHSIVPMFVDLMVWAPERRWSQIVIEQCALVPKSDHDDMYDTVTMFLHWAREAGILIRADENEAMLQDEMTYKPRSESVAQTYGV